VGEERRQSALPELTKRVAQVGHGAVPLTRPVVRAHPWRDA